MKTKQRTAVQITQEGFAALCDKLGMADAIRFIQLFDLGHGDYTLERANLFKGETVKSLVAKIRQSRRSHRKKKI
jgi:hypothetical protein